MSRDILFFRVFMLYFSSIVKRKLIFLRAIISHGSKLFETSFPEIKKGRFALCRKYVAPPNVPTLLHLLLYRGVTYLLNERIQLLAVFRANLFPCKRYRWHSKSALIPGPKPIQFTATVVHDNKQEISPFSPSNAITSRYIINLSFNEN